MAGLIQTYGALHLMSGEPADLFGLLVRAVVSQQVSAKAAASLLSTVESRIGAFGPEAILELGASGLRECGLTTAKSDCIVTLATSVIDGVLRLEELTALDDDDVHKELVRFRGIGPWTAQMFLIFSLGRPDVFPAHDLGIREALRRQYQLGKLPDSMETEQMGSTWHPFRSYAACYLWRSLHNLPPIGRPALG